MQFPTLKEQEGWGILLAPAAGVSQPSPKARIQLHLGLRGEAAEIFGFYQLKTD